MPDRPSFALPFSPDSLEAKVFGAVITAFILLSCFVLVSTEMNLGRWIALVTLLLWVPMGLWNATLRQERPGFRGQIWFSTFYVLNPLAVLVGTGGYASPYYPYLILTGIICALFNPMPYLLFFELVLGTAYFTFFLQEPVTGGTAVLEALWRIAAMMLAGVAFRFFLEALQRANQAMYDYQQRLEASHGQLEVQASQLSQSHHHINHLADQAEGLLAALTREDVDRASGPLDLISAMFWPNGPSYLFVGKGPVGTLYRVLGDRVEVVRHEAHLAVSLPPSGGCRVFNGMDEPVFREIEFRPGNMVAYCREGTTMIALGYPGPVGELEAQFLKNLAVHGQFLDLVTRNQRELEGAFIYTIGALARASEANDEETGNHIVRVNSYAELLASHLGAPDRFVRTIAFSAQMHDVGKIHVSPLIMRKAGPLTPEEFDEMKCHTLYGPRILGDSPRLQMAREIAIAHHEKWDGTGYPYGLKGEAIPLSARIVAIGDIYDALRSRRPYKPEFNHDKASAIILEGDGRVMPNHFDPQILEAFRKIHLDFEAIYEQLRDDDEVAIAV